MALLTPSALTEIWNVDPSPPLTKWYVGGAAGVQVGDGGLLVVGISASGGMGCNLIQFDTTTGEPTDFDQNALATGDDSFIGVFHFPDEDCVVLFARDNVGTGGTTLYGQRVEYDIAACTLTGGAIATWTPNNGTNNLLTFAADVPDSSTINVLGWGTVSFGATTLDLSAGTNSGRTNYTLATVGIDGGRDRLELGVGGLHHEGVALIDGYVNASGAATGDAFAVTFDGGTPVATNLGLGRYTANGATFPLSDTETFVHDLTYASGGTADRILDGSGTSALPSAEVLTAATVWVEDILPTYTGKFVTFNREGATLDASNTLRARRYTPSTGTEVAAWEYPSLYTDYNSPSFGMMSSDQRFFWAGFGLSSFRVYEDPDWVPTSERKWWVGVTGWGG